MYSDSDPPKPDPAISIAGVPRSSSSCSPPPAPAPAPPQELTLSYLCGEKDQNTPTDLLFPPPPPAPPSRKGKEIAGGDESAPHEHDFLQLGSKRRETGGVQLNEPDEKKPKLGSLNLSLSLNSSEPACGGTGPASVGTGPAPAVQPVQAKRAYSTNTRTNTVISDDFNPSLSYSYSMPFSHNPSCSLTRNSTENFDFSRENEQIWHAGEGTNGSVHSKFKPIGESIIFAASTANQGPPPGASSFFRANNINPNPNNPNGSDTNISFFPSELPARPPPAVRVNPLTSASSDGPHRQLLVLSRPDRFLRELVSEPLQSVAAKLDSLPSETLDSLRDTTLTLITSPDRRDELSSLQRKLDRRSDLTLETLTAKTHKTHLQILTALKTLNPKLLLSPKIPQNELAEIFLSLRCRNLACKSLLPVDDCDCKICSAQKGFCSACMCPVCFNFDCANNTCSWVGCDVCSHWCHTSCALNQTLIRPGPTLKGPLGTTEMQFHCLGCGHASEMLGFVKEVFNCCAKMWGEDVLKKELECVRRIFGKSEDFEGKGVCGKAEELGGLLGRKGVSREVACESMLEFFKYGVTEFSVTGSKPSKSPSPLLLPHSSPSELSLNPFSFPPSPPNPSPNSLPPPPPNPNPNPNSTEGEGGKSLETVVKCKEAEAKLFQRLADDARREVEKYRQIVRAQAEKLEEEYGASLARLCLQEAEERRRKKIEELKMLENSQGDYQKMKMRMQTEIASLLERMEATKKMWV